MAHLRIKIREKKYVKFEFAVIASEREARSVAIPWINTAPTPAQNVKFEFDPPATKPAPTRATKPRNQTGIHSVF